MSQQRVFSGIRPTGQIHLGNYLGAIKQWIHLQKTHKDSQFLFCVVDLHALTEFQMDGDLKSDIYLITAAYLASGIDPKQSVIFSQSSVPGHAELSWILGCFTPLGWLNRMTQFKEKSGKQKDSACLGLYAYPTLMAADILLYQSTAVPVGEDQKQHVELARDLAISFNSKFKQDFFNVPEPLIMSEGARIMSLRDGTSKMSKSDLSDYSRIHLTDTVDQIKVKIQKAKTDSGVLPESPDGLAERPEAYNLLNIYALLSGGTLSQACEKFAGQNFSALKMSLVEVIEQTICPIGAEINKYLQDKSYLDQVLLEGAQKARELSEVTIQNIYKLLGLFGRKI